MKAIEAGDLLDGVALLECINRLYEYAGFEDGKFIFQSINGEGRIITSYENLLTMPEYSVQY